MKQILIVDDDVVSRELLRLSLLAKGHNPDVAPDLQSARTLLTTQPFDLVILDVNLPDGLGFDLLNEIREEHKYTYPIIILSGLQQEVNVERGLHLGANEYFTKPFQLDELLVRIDQLLDKPNVTLH